MYNKYIKDKINSNERELISILEEEIDKYDKIKEQIWEIEKVLYKNKTLLKIQQKKEYEEEIAELENQKKELEKKIKNIITLNINSSEFINYKRILNGILKTIWVLVIEKNIKENTKDDIGDDFSWEDFF